MANQEVKQALQPREVPDNKVAKAANLDKEDNKEVSKVVNQEGKEVRPEDRMLKVAKEAKVVKEDKAVVKEHKEAREAKVEVREDNRDLAAKVDKVADREDRVDLEVKGVKVVRGDLEVKVALINNQEDSRVRLL